MKRFFSTILLWFCWLIFWWMSFSLAQTAYDDLIVETVSWWEDEFWWGNTLIDFLDTTIVDVESLDINWGEWIRDLLITFAVKVILPITVFAWIVLALFGFYKLMIAGKNTEDIKEAFKYIIWWTIGIVIMISAWWIVNAIIWPTWEWLVWWGNGWTVLQFWNWDDLNGTQLAADVYNKIIFPFLNLFLNFAMAILFLIVLINALKFIFKPEKTWNEFSMILYALLWIILIYASKWIVTIVYGDYQNVIVDLSSDNPDPGELGQIWLIWGDIWAGGTWEALEIIWWIVNWVLGMATFIVMIIIIYLAYLLLMNPWDEERFTRIKKYFIYLVVGIFVIGSAYILSRVMITTGQ